VRSTFSVAAVQVPATTVAAVARLVWQTEQVDDRSLLVEVLMYLLDQDIESSHLDQGVTMVRP
jgi:hypothetical protein